MNSNLAYQEDFSEELIDGKIVMMSPRPSINHYQVAHNIAKLFDNFLKGKPCRAFGDGVDLYLDERNYFVPDGMVVCDRSKIKADGVYGAPDLVVEVLSPSTSRYDRGAKMRVYEKAGVREYWLVNPADKTVEQYFLDAGKLDFHDSYSILPDYLLKKMTEEERAGLITKFHCSLYDDLEILLEDVFADTF